MEKQTNKRPLDEVMLAMDVVDTLRHRQILVERELHFENRDQKLMERLREIYASQGIDVPDHVLAEGVSALKEERFVYTPPKRGFSLVLARIYIQRKHWAKRAGMALLVFLFLWVGVLFLITGPSDRRLTRHVTELNDQVREASDKLNALERDALRIEKALSKTSLKPSKEFQETFAYQRKTATASLDRARGIMASAGGEVQQSRITPDLYKAQADALGRNLGKQQDQIAQASGEIDKAERALATITALESGPLELSIQRDAALDLSKAEDAKKLARQYYESGMAALRAGDLNGIDASEERLKKLRKELEEEYEIRIVSRPKEYSGIWRLPEGNSKAKNYYIVVEAIRPDGKVLTLPILNEEDGKIYNVTKWGLRVDQQLFQRITADKKDDGIIQKRKFGSKRRGYLELEYGMPTTGAAITDW